jgi:hypothetical protein
MADRAQVITEIERYWLETGLPTEAVAEMRGELEQHLIEAELRGRSVDDVIGDRAAFAEGWATARKGRTVASWSDVQSGSVRRRKEVERRECLDLLVRGSTGHGREVIQLWHLCLIVSRLKERNRVN